VRRRIGGWGAGGPSRRLKKKERPVVKARTEVGKEQKTQGLSLGKTSQPEKKSLEDRKRKKVSNAGEKRKGGDLNGRGLLGPGRCGRWVGGKSADSSWGKAGCRGEERGDVLKRVRVTRCQENIRMGGSRQTEDASPGKADTLWGKGDSRK